MAIIWKLKSYLKQHQISPNALSEQVKNELSRTAVYNLVNDKPPIGIHFDTLNVLIPALTGLTRQPVSLYDLLEYQPEPTLDWRSFIGFLNRDFGREK